MKHYLPILLAGALAITVASSTASAADIVETAVAGNFNTLVAAVKAARLVDTLKGPGPFTVFAPTDEAFAKLPPGTLESLLQQENKAKLQSILTYHVVAGNRARKGCREDSFCPDRGRPDHHHQDHEWPGDGGQRQRNQNRHCDIEWRDSCHRFRPLAEMTGSASSCIC